MKGMSSRVSHGNINIFHGIVARSVSASGSRRMCRPQDVSHASGKLRIRQETLCICRYSLDMRHCRRRSTARRAACEKLRMPARTAGQTRGNTPVFAGNGASAEPGPRKCRRPAWQRVRAEPPSRCGCPDLRAVLLNARFSGRFRRNSGSVLRRGHA